MVYLFRNDGETVERFLGRFRRKVQASGKLDLVKDKRAFRGKVNKRAIRKSAAHRQRIRERLDYLEKTGQV